VEFLLDVVISKYVQVHSEKMFRLVKFEFVLLWSQSNATCVLNDFYTLRDICVFAIKMEPPYKWDLQNCDCNDGGHHDMEICPPRSIWVAASDSSCSFEQQSSELLCLFWCGTLSS
jgi:hypothetical protein